MVGRPPVARRSHARRQRATSKDHTRRPRRRDITIVPARCASAALVCVRVCVRACVRLTPNLQGRLHSCGRQAAERHVFSNFHHLRPRPYPQMAIGQLTTTGQLAAATAPPRRSARLATTGSVWVIRHGERADVSCCNLAPLLLLLPPTPCRPPSPPRLHAQVADPDWYLSAPRPHDPPLTALGERQAMATGVALAASATHRPVAIYCSPFLRCVQTAAQIARKLGVKIRIEPGLCEVLHGEWFDDMPVDAGMAINSIATAIGDASLLDRSYRPFVSTTALTFPEEWHDSTARYQNTLRLIQEHAPFAACVSHGAGVQAMAESIEGLVMGDDDEIEYCCLTHLHRQGGSGWKCASLASAAHTAHME